MKKFLIHFLDKIDHYLIRHRCGWLCNRIGDSSWWGEEPCHCSYCERARS